MARQPLAWPNVEKQLLAWMKADGLKAYTETPLDLAAKLPCHRITRVGGGDQFDRIGITKLFQVEVETFAGSRGDLWDAVAEAQTTLYALAANGTADWYVDEVTETFAAALVDYENGDVRKASATYGIAVRPHH